MMQTISGKSLAVPVGTQLTFGCPFGMVMAHNKFLTPSITVQCNENGEFSGPNPLTWNKWPLWPTCKCIYIFYSSFEQYFVNVQ